MFTLMYLCILASHDQDLEGIKFYGVIPALVLDLLCVMQAADYFYHLTLG